MSKPIVEAEVDGREFERALVNFQRETELGWGEVIKMQARLLVERLIEWTPPFGKDKAAQKKGMAKVDSDIRRVFIPFKDVPFLVKEIAQQRLEGLAGEKDFDKVEFRNGKIQKEWEQKDWPALRVIFGRSVEAQARRMKITKTPDHADHQAARVAGRVRKRRQPNVVIERAASLKSYIREVQRRVGTAKAGWIRGAQLLTAKFPAWIGKTGGESLGSVQDNSANPLNPSITVSNEVPYASDIFPSSKMSELLSTRIRDMEKNAERFVDAKRRKAGL